MKKFLLSIVIACFGLCVANAYEVNLLDGCYGSDETLLGSKEQFYAVWQCYDGNGRLMTADGSPLSYFSKVSLVDNGGTVKPCYTNQNNQISEIPGEPSTEIFPEDANLMVLLYDSMNLCYAFPISVAQAGTYTLSGSIAISLGNTNQGFTDNLGQIVFVANPDPSVKITSMTIASKDGRNYIKVVNQEGEELASAFTPASESMQSHSFNVTIDLTPEDEYLTIFAPSRTLFLCNLALTGDLSGMNSVETPEAADIQAAERLFDLTGRAVSMEGNGLQKGIYIRKTGKKTEKILLNN